MSTSPSIGATTLYAATCDEAYALTLEHVLSAGHHFSTHPADSPDKARGSTETIGLQIQIESPRDRVLRNPARQLNPVGAIARFVWMVSGSDRLADIAYYEPKVGSVPEVC